MAVSKRRSRARPRARAGEYHHGDLRRALLRAATSLLDDGDAAPSLREVARRAGVSAAAPYHHFANRTQLLAAMAIEGFAGLEAALREACGSLDDPDAILATSCATYVRFAVEHPTHYGLMFSADYADPTEFADYHAAGQAAFSTLADKVGAVRPDLSPARCQSVAHQVWALAHGASCLRIDSLDTKRTLSECAASVGDAALVLTRSC